MTRSRYASRSSALEEMLCFDLHAAARAMSRRYRPLLAHLGLTYPQYLVLVVLGADGPATLKELAGALRLDHATLTPMVRRMEDAGLVVRDSDPADGRLVRLSLTAAGQDAAATSEDIQCRLREDLGLGPEEMRALQQALRGVAESAEQAVRGDLDGVGA